MNDKILFSLIFVISVFIATISQVLLKKSALKHYKNKFKEYLNLQVIFAYCLFFICTLITVSCYKKVPLSFGPILESSGYVFVSILGFFFLGERFSKKKILGMLIIIFGIFIFSL